VKLAGIELELVLSSKHERIVRNDNTVAFQAMVLAVAADQVSNSFSALCGDRTSSPTTRSASDIKAGC